MRQSAGRESLRTLRTDFWVDLSLSILRKPWSQGAKPFRANGHVYSYQADRCISGEDALQILGMPLIFLDGITAGDALRLAEVSSCLPIVTLMQTVMWCCPWGPWNTGTAPV